MFETNIFAIIRRIVIQIWRWHGYFGIFGGEEKLENYVRRDNNFSVESCRSCPLVYRNLRKCRFTWKYALLVFCGSELQKKCSSKGTWLRWVLSNSYRFCMLFRWETSLWLNGKRMKWGRGDNIRKSILGIDHFSLINPILLLLVWNLIPMYVDSK